MLVNPARGSDPVDQLALNLDSQTLDSICQLDLSHLGNLSAGVGTENVVFKSLFRRLNRNTGECVTVIPIPSYTLTGFAGNVPKFLDLILLRAEEDPV